MLFGVFVLEGVGGGVRGLTHLPFLLFVLFENVAARGRDDS